MTPPLSCPRLGGSQQLGGEALLRVSVALSEELYGGSFETLLAAWRPSLQSSPVCLQIKMQNSQLLQHHSMLPAMKMD